MFGIPSFLIAPLISLVAVVAMFGLDRVHVAQRDSARTELAALRVEVASEAQRVRAIEQGQESVAERVAATHVRTIERVRTVTNTIEKEVPKYVSLTDDRACRIGWGFVWVHDAAATGDVPPPPDQPVGAPLDLRLSQVATVLARNYGRCLEWRTEAATWREWYTRNAAIANNPATEVKGQ